MTDAVRAWRNRNARRTAVICGGVVVLACSFAADLATGPAMLPIPAVIRSLLGSGSDPMLDAIVRSLRLPIAWWQLAYSSNSVPHCHFTGEPAIRQRCAREVEWLEHPSLIQPTSICDGGDGSPANPAFGQDCCYGRVVAHLVRELRRKLPDETAQVMFTL